MKDPVVQVGDPVLHTVARPVPKKDIGSRKLSALLKKMSATLKKEGFGVAIAAPQVGVGARVFVVAGKVFRPDISEDDAADDTDAPLPPDRVFINPELVRVSKAKKEMTEGCLSVRHKYGSVLRHEKASVRALNEKGEEFVYHGAGLIGQIFQHEVDHLNGILYIDKAVLVTPDEEWKELKEKRAAKHD